MIARYGANPGDAVCLSCDLVYWTHNGLPVTAELGVCDDCGGPVENVEEDGSTTPPRQRRAPWPPLDQHLDHIDDRLALERAIGSDRFPETTEGITPGQLYREAREAAADDFLCQFDTYLDHPAHQRGVS